MPRFFSQLYSQRHFSRPATPLALFVLSLGLLAGCAGLSTDMGMGTGGGVQGLEQAQGQSSGPSLPDCSLPTLLGQSGPLSAAEARAAAEAAQLPTRTRAVFVLDTSGSMVGLGDGQADIFEAVKAAILDYVAAQRPAEVVLFTFDSGLRSERLYLMPAERRAFEADMRALVADGSNTYLYRSLAESLPTVQGNPDLLTTVFVLTDGQDNDPTGEFSAVAAVDSLGARGALDTLHYVALGTEIPEDAQAALNESSYAEGLTLPVGEAPNLLPLGNRLGTLEADKKSGGAAQGRWVGTDWPVGTPLVLQTPTLDWPARLSLSEGTVQTRSVTEPPTQAEPPESEEVSQGNVGQVSAIGLPEGPESAVTASGAALLQSSGSLPAGMPALLCAPPVQEGGLTRRTLVRVGGASGADMLAAGDLSGLTWLNPAADLKLRPGESVTLHLAVPPEARYSAAAGMQGGIGVGGQTAQQEAALGQVVAEGLRAEVLGGAGSSRSVRVRLTNDHAPAGTVIQPRWVLPSGLSFALPAVTADAGRTVNLPAEPDPTPDSNALEPAPQGVAVENAPFEGPQFESPQFESPELGGVDLGDTETYAPAPWGGLGLLGSLLLLALLGAGAWWVLRGADGGLRQGGGGVMGKVRSARNPVSNAAKVLRARARQPQPKRRVTVGTAPATPPPRRPVHTNAAATATQYSAAPYFSAMGAQFGEMPTIEGLEFAEDGTLALFDTGGRVVGGVIETPLDSPFDLGQRAGVPHLSGLRLERCAEGLRLLRLPADLEVSRGTRLLNVGDTVRHGTLLGVQMADSVRAKSPPLGELSGLGLPLTLSSEGTLLKIVGRYAEHHVTLPTGMTDLGVSLGAPALRGLWLMLLDDRVLIADVPTRLTLLRPRIRGARVAPKPLRPGTYLPEGTRMVFKGFEVPEEERISAPAESGAASGALGPKARAQSGGEAGRDIPVVVRRTQSYAAEQGEARGPHEKQTGAQQAGEQGAQQPESKEGGNA